MSSISGKLSPPIESEAAETVSPLEQASRGFSTSANYSTRAAAVASPANTLTSFTFASGPASRRAGNEESKNALNDTSKSSRIRTVKGATKPVARSTATSRNAKNVSKGPNVSYSRNARRILRERTGALVRFNTRKFTKRKMITAPPPPSKVVTRPGAPVVPNTGEKNR